MSLASLDWGRVGGVRRKGAGLSGLVIDVPLLVIVLMISEIGFVVLYSALGADMGLLLRQGLRFARGTRRVPVLLAGAAALFADLHAVGVLLGLGLLLVVMVEGEIGKGAQRWLDLGIVTFQPSELMKLAAPMMVAWFMHDRRLPPTFLQVVVVTLIVLVPAVIIAEQPDLGTAMLVIAGGALAILLAGVSTRIILSVGCSASRLCPCSGHYMRDYQRARVFMFLNPESDPLGAGYNTIQAKIAIGSGGLFGKGWMNGTQAHLEFLPERSTDFIFAVMGEEFGLLGLCCSSCCTSRSSAAACISRARRRTRSRGCWPARWPDLLLLRIRERGHGLRTVADRRRAVAARKRRRHVDGDPHGGFRYARGDPWTSEVIAP